MQLDRPSARPVGLTERLLPQPWRAFLARAADAAALRRLLTWETPALLTILTAALLLNTWHLAQNGWANEYYSAAALSASESWKAFLFGSADAANFMTIDKPPLSLWPQALAVRLFGFNSWSLLLPEALISVASVAVLYRVVRMTAGRIAAIVAATALAVSPISVAVSRDNIPEPLLVLLLLLGAWALVSAIQTGRMLPLMLSAVAIGLAFNTKLLQAYMVLPAFALAYLVCAPGPVRGRIVKLTAAGGVLAAVSLIWIAAVAITPATDRPYIGGSSDNTAVNLILGYDGLGRLTGFDDTPGPGLGNAGPHFGGDAAVNRLFNNQLAGEISWLVPAAIFALVAALYFAMRTRRTDRARVGPLLWGGWFAVHASVFSLQEGIFHPYYTAALVPSIAALAGIGGVAAWKLSQRNAGWALFGGVTLSVTAYWAGHVLDWDPATASWLEPLIIASAVVASACWFIAAMLAQHAGRAARDVAAGPDENEAWDRPWWVRRSSLIAALGGLTVAAGGVAAFSAPASFALNPLDSAVQGVNPTASPAIFARQNGPPRGFNLGGNGQRAGTAIQNGQGGTGGVANGQGTNNRNPGGQFGAQGGVRPQGAVQPQAPGTQGQTPGGSNPPPNANSGPRGGFALPPNASVQAADPVVTLLIANYHGERWIAATTDSTSAARLIIATREPVMGMGGFNSTDPAPTIDQLQGYIAAGELRYVVLGGTGGFGLNGQGDRTNWVRANCSPVNISTNSATSGQNRPTFGGRGGGEQIYDCSGAVK